MMTKVIPTDVYENNGDMKGIEFNNLDGGFIVFAEWDSVDAQTSENRVKFREWAYHMATQLGYEVVK
jgi:hypothetical protein